MEACEGHAETNCPNFEMKCQNLRSSTWNFKLVKIWLTVLRNQRQNVEIKFLILTYQLLLPLKLRIYLRVKGVNILFW